MVQKINKRCQPISHAMSTFTTTIHSLRKLPCFFLIKNRNKKIIFAEVLEIFLEELRLGKLRTCLVTYGFVFIFIFHFLYSFSLLKSYIHFLFPTLFLFGTIFGLVFVFLKSLYFLTKPFVTITCQKPLTQLQK